ncbi:hypothetical protein KY342_03280 [Candidatus Woesearchaeota archaeon]|nr:hypothetical protein [Candidatus Woesearchaeota archaeon]
MRYAKLISIFVMFLIVSLPSAFAISLEVTRSSGNDNVEEIFDGYSDQWNIEVRAELGGIEVRPEMVRAHFSSSTVLDFDSCSQEAYPFYSCSLKFPSTPASFFEDILNISIKLTHPTTFEVSQSSAMIKIDQNPPEVKINKAFQDGYNATIDFSVKDIGSIVCSVERVEFFDGNLRVGEVSLNITDCNWHNNISSVRLTDIGTTLKSIKVIGYDLIGHAGIAQTDVFSLDHTGPQIDIDSFGFTAFKDDQYISGTTTLTEIKVNVTEEQTTVDADGNRVEEVLNVTGDFLQIGYGEAEQADCELVGDGIYTCTWSERSIRIPSNFAVSVTAVDNNGISSTQVISKGYLVDSTAPEVIYLGGNESGYVVKDKTNILRATFRETGSGIDSDGIILDVRGINPDVAAYSSLEADECIQEGELWNCYWTVIAKHAGEVKLIQVKDTANNFAVSLPSARLEMDLDAPVFIPSLITGRNIDISSLGQVQAEVVPFTQEGSYFYIKAVLNDTSGVKAVADFRRVVSNVGKVAADCQQSDENEWTCIWSGIGPIISVATTRQKTVDFEFTDFVGNGFSVTEEVTIVDTGVEEANPDYWNSNQGAVTMPAMLDRRIVSRINPYVYVPVELNPATYSAPRDKWPLFIKDIQCTSDYLGDPAEIFNYNLAIPELGSGFPYTFYIKLNLQQLAPVDDSITIPCRFKIMSFIFDRALPNPETEQINLTISYYQNPLGEVGEQVEDEIEDVKEGWLVQGDWIDTLEQFVKYSEILCTGMKMYYEVVTKAIGASKDGLVNCCNLPWSSAACCPAAASTGVATTVNKEALEKTFKAKVNKYCKFINCQLWYLSKNDDGNRAVEAFKRWLNKAAAADKHKGYLGNVKIENSLVLSLAFLCPKGIAYNLQKARQIDCFYAYCLQQTADGMPVSVCVRQRAFAMCKYVFGQIFNLIPFAATIADISEAIGGALANPYVMGEIALRASCRYAICDIPNVAGCKACSIVEFASWVLEVTCDLGIGGIEGCEPFWERLAPIEDNYCSKIED